MIALIKRPSAGKVSNLLLRLSAILTVPITAFGICPLPAFAEAHHIDDLDTPNRIWVRSTVPETVQKGLTLPFLSFISFQDGRFHDQIAYSHRVIGQKSCGRDYFKCSESVNSTAVVQGSYRLENGDIHFDDQSLSPLTFERPDFTAHLFLPHTFSAGDAKVPMAFQDGSFNRVTPFGIVTYRPAMKSDVEDILGLITEQATFSFHKNYDCLVNGHISRKSLKHPDELSLALIALAQFGAAQKALSEDISKATGDDPSSYIHMSDEEKAHVDYLNTLSNMILIASNTLKTEFQLGRDGGNKDFFPDVPHASDLGLSNMYENMSSDELAQLFSDLETNLSLVRTALPAITVLDQYSYPNSADPLLCHTGSKDE